MKRLLILIVLLMGGCHNRPEAVQQVNAEFRVETLFRKDGCTVYRFEDGGKDRYFTNCSGASQWRESCGKNCTRNVEINGGAR